MTEVAALVRAIVAAGFAARPYLAGVEVRLPGCWRERLLSTAGSLAKVRKGICYWETYSAARIVRRQYPGSRVVGYGLGYAVQLRLSGPYVGPDDLTG